MKTFSLKDLRERTGELVREAEEGKLAIVTKHGQPLFFALPFDELLLREGVNVATAIHLFKEGLVGLSRAAKLANVSSSEMMDILSVHNIPIAHNSSEDVIDEVKQLMNP